MKRVKHWYRVTDATGEFVEEFESVALALKWIADHATQELLDYAYCAPDGTFDYGRPLLPLTLMEHGE